MGLARGDGDDGVSAARAQLSSRLLPGSSQKLLLLLLHRAEKKAAGFKTVKCKVGQGLEEDAAACKAVREAIGSSHTLRVDANMGWSTYEELSLIHI